MALDPTARFANVMDSIKRYLVENLYETENIPVLFDTDLSTPKLQGHTVDKWITVNFGDKDRKAGWLILTLLCCTRKDEEGFKLAQLTDKALGYLSDNTTTGGFRMIPFYQSAAVGDWTLLAGGFAVIIEGESEQLRADDGTKFVIINCRLLWANKF